VAALTFFIGKNNTGTFAVTRASEGMTRGDSGFVGSAIISRAKPDQHLPRVRSQSFDQVLIVAQASL
jgi:hypothetical protein